MSFSLIPKYSFFSLTEISPEFLQCTGIKLLMMDLDNTIAPYGKNTPEDGVYRWADKIKSGGIGLYIVSNSHRNARVESFGKALGISYINRAGKPSPGGVLRAVRESGLSAGETALVGDQIFTDTIAANLAGSVSIIVPPISCKNPLFAARYALEMPFRAFCKNKVR